MNKLIITGNLTADPELRATPQGTSVCSFTVAVNERRNGQTDATFFRVTAWNAVAENCKHYLIKGSKAMCIGRVGVDVYKTHDGETRAALTLNAQEVEFLSSKAEASPEKQEVKAHDPVPVETPDDLPF